MGRELVYYNDELTALQWALNSAVECHLHTVEVIGSNPIAPTTRLRGPSATLGISAAGSRSSLAETHSRLLSTSSSNPVASTFRFPSPRSSLRGAEQFSPGRDQWSESPRDGAGFCTLSR